MLPGTPGSVSCATTETPPSVPPPLLDAPLLEPLLLPPLELAPLLEPLLDPPLLDPPLLLAPPSLPAGGPLLLFDVHAAATHAAPTTTPIPTTSFAFRIRFYPS
jgi:hypothetical protein